MVFSVIVESFIASNEALKQTTRDEAWRMGRDCALNGPNDENSHFRFFTTPQLTQAWTEGRQSLE